jgi:hypothetical protein
MKQISFFFKNLILVLSIVAVCAGCKGHKKAKCNDCPKWSNIQKQDENRCHAKTQSSQRKTSHYTLYELCVFA